MKNFSDGEKEQLQEKIALYESVLDHLSQGVYITDEKETIIWVNKVILANENASLPEMIGRKEYEVWPDMYPASTNRYKLKEGSPAKGFMLSFFSKSGEKRDILTFSYPYFVDDKIKYIYSVGNDANYSDRQIARILEYRNKYLTNRENNQNGAGFTFSDFIGVSAPIREMLNIAKKVAVKNIPVMIWGQTGVGKEIIAQGIHNASLFRNGNFVGINCAAIPENLLETLMFGSVKGAFTGAMDAKGYLEEAAGGTLFLDEINSMPMALQSKLLRVFQERRFTRIGSNKQIEVTCRVVSATNQHPQKLVEDGILRQDLFFRLSVVLLNIPPLKARKQDLPYLLQHFLQKYNNEYNLNIEGLNKSCREAIYRYDWPGNVRELEHVLEYMMNVTTETKMLRFDDLPPYLRDALNSSLSVEGEKVESQSLSEIMAHYEAKVLKAAMENNNHNITQTARSLGVRRETLYYRLHKLGLDPRE